MTAARQTKSRAGGARRAAVALAIAAGAAGARGPSPDSALRFDPDRVTALELRQEVGAAPNRVERASPAWAGWSLRRAEGASGDPGWPVDPARVRSALRALADLRITPTSLSDGARGDSNAMARSAVVTLEGGESVRIEAEDRGVSGLVRARGARTTAAGEAPEYRGFFVDAASLLAAFGTSPLAWRDRSAMPGVGVDAHRIRVSLPNGESVALSREPEGWRIAAPMPGRADQRAVAELIHALSTCLVDSFSEEITEDMKVAADRDARNDGERGWLSSFSVETDVAEFGAGAGIVRRTRERAMMLGGPLGPERDGLHGASLRLKDAGESLVERAIVRWAPPKCLAAGLAFDAPTASGALPADVGEIVVSAPDGSARIRLWRGIDGWESREGADAAGAEALAAAWLEFLCGRSAASVRVFGQGEAPAFRAAASIELLDVHGNTLDVVEIGEARRSESDPWRPAALERANGLSRLREFDGELPALSAE